MRSRVYRGWVRHRREKPRSHTFAYRLYMMYLDLTELDELFDRRWLWSADKPNLAWFRRRDHFGDPEESLSSSVRSLVSRDLGRSLDGPICLLTHLRYFGYCMNPVSFYYCWDAGGRALDAIVAEIHNTPWGETHCYVLDSARHERHEFRKSFHVSPFMDMDQQYRWRLSAPGQTLSVNMQNFECGRRVFNATLCMREEPVTGPNLARVLTRYPFMTGKVIGAIYWQAARLWCKGIPFHAHPKQYVSARQASHQVER